MEPARDLQQPDDDRPDRYGGDGLDFARDRLTLRFHDLELEREFQVDLGERLTLQLRGGLFLAALLWVSAAILLPLTYGLDPVPIATAIAVPLAFVLGGLWWVGRVRSWDAQQVINAVINLVGGLSMIVVSTRIAGIPELAAAALILNAIFAFGAVRIGFTIGLAAQVPVLIWLGALAWIGTYAEIGWFVVFLVGSAVGVSAFGAYMLESSSRARFLQRRELATQSEALAREKAKSDRLLHSMLPVPIAHRLREQPGIIADGVADATVVFADLVGSTALGSRMSPADLVAMLNALFERFDDLADRHGLEKIKTVGDGYMAVAGAPNPTPDHADRAVRFGLGVRDATRALGAELGLPLEVRVGVHSGPLVAGVIGRDKLAYDLWGDTVNIASRMESQGIVGRVQVSEATAERLRQDVALEPRGTIDVRGRGPMRVLLVRETAGEELPPVEPAPKITA